MDGEIAQVGRVRTVGDRAGDADEVAVVGAGDDDEVGSGQHADEALDVVHGTALGEGGSTVDADDLLDVQVGVDETLTLPHTGATPRPLL
ncbi:hypothetical protein ACWGIU_31115, partial [Streptomyces sp. NPDC054840]